jgi:hypothetical protein
MKVHEGVISFWMKPGYFPEMSGKSRRPINLDRIWSQPGDETVASMGPEWIWFTRPFGIVFAPAHDALADLPSLAESAVTSYLVGSMGGGVVGVSAPKPCSLGFGFGFTYNDSSASGGGYLAQGGIVTPTLNHLGHVDASPMKSPLQAHKWIHVSAAWKMPAVDQTTLLVNGRRLPGTSDAWNVPSGSFIWGTPPAWDWLDHVVAGESKGRNSIRLGSTTRYALDQDPFHKMNEAADATVDELYVWDRRDFLTDATYQWQDGRYYKPLSSGEGIHRSMPFHFDKQKELSQRFQPPTSDASFGGDLPTIATAPATAPGVIAEVVGLSWTWFGEGVDPHGRPTLLDCSEDPETTLYPEVGLSLLVDDVSSDEYLDDRYSAILSGGEFLPILDESLLKIQVRIGLPGAEISSLLLATPVVDDITLYWRLSTMGIVEASLE